MVQNWRGGTTRVGSTPSRGSTPNRTWGTLPRGERLVSLCEHSQRWPGKMIAIYVSVTEYLPGPYLTYLMEIRQREHQGCAAGGSLSPRQTTQSQGPEVISTLGYSPPGTLEGCFFLK